MTTKLLDSAFTALRPTPFRPMEQAKAKILGAVGEYLKNPGER